MHAQQIVMHTVAARWVGDYMSLNVYISYKCSEVALVLRYFTGVRPSVLCLHLLLCVWDTPYTTHQDATGPPVTRWPPLPTP